VSHPGSRTLRLLSLLQSRRFWSGAELAERLEVSARTLRRDIDRLRQLGYPVEAQRGVDGGYQLAPGAVLPPLVLDDDEAVAIGVGLQSAIQGGTVVGIEEASVRALTKVVHVMPSRLRRQIDALAAVTDPAPWAQSAASVDADVLVSLAQACRDGERLGFTYTARGGEQTTRSVDPHRLVLLGRLWYLVAWDLSRFDWRTFRLDRLTAPGTTGHHVMPRELPGGNAAEFVKSSIDGLPSRHQVEALVHAPAPRVRERIGRWATLEEAGDDRCLLRMSADTLDWPSMVLGNTEAEFEVLSPPALVDHLRDWAERFGRAVGGNGHPVAGRRRP
jgi:predicted DNA-binding transcriptional regulator YafY